MNQQAKERLLAQAQGHVDLIRGKIGQKLQEIKKLAHTIAQKLSKLSPQDQLVQARVLQNQVKWEAELGALYPSPYFIKCEIVFEGTNSPRIFYFSRFSKGESGIYSWTSPAAVLRFEDPGSFSYMIPEFGNKKGVLVSKDQYMIVNGRIVYMATEAVDKPRELVYQEYFSDRKEGFLLREIVEQMEKAQDKVIRAPVQGSFLITGPAGSGKTTLALHRVAYLLQSPDTASRFRDTAAIVFVQDTSTKEYFGKLLPQLGVENVRIVTFEEWARERLGLENIGFVFRYGNSELERDALEFAKNAVLKMGRKLFYQESTWALLEGLYKEYLPTELFAVFEKQKKDRVLDRFDLMLLLKSFADTYNGFNTYEVQYTQLKGGKVKRIKLPMPLRYSLMILDEVQNFLPEQISLLQACLDTQNHSIMYVGDLAQQTRLCTIRSWDEIGEHLNDDQIATLQKNYRSTQQILEYIRSQGYDVVIPKGLKQGPEVKEVTMSSNDEAIMYINNATKGNTQTIGILGQTHENINTLREIFYGKENIHVLTVHEAQGVEFDAVFVISSTADSSVEATGPALQAEASRVRRDLYYVALTRAMNELYILTIKD